MSDPPPEQSPRQSSDHAAQDAIAAMHEHIAHLESELAIAVHTLAQMEGNVDAGHQRADAAFNARDYEAFRQIVTELDANWETRDEEVGLLKADIRVLRVLLAECHEWLETAQRPR